MVLGSIILDLKGKSRLKLEDKLDTMKCKTKCFCHSVFTIKYRELVKVSILIKKCSKCDIVADMFDRVINIIIKSEIETTIFYLYSNELFDFQKDDADIKFKDLIIKTQYRMGDQLHPFKCYNCEDNQDLKITRLVIDPSKVF